MKNLGRWPLAVAAIAIFGWAALRIPPGNTHIAISKPSAAVDRSFIRADDRISHVHHTDALHAQNHQTWAAQFHSARFDYFEFVTRAAKAAYGGDGEAQYYIGRALAHCEETNALHQNAESTDEALSQLAYSPALLELARQESLRCSRFRRENPFKGLPKRQGGYSTIYWQSHAVAARYPVAVIAAALDSPDSDSPQVIATELATGNPDAMLLFGWTEATANAVSRAAPILATAWVIAACRSGANCGSTNDVLPFSVCGAGIELGCTEHYTAGDELVARLGEEEFEQANLLAQDIQASLLYHDAAQLKKYMPF